MGILRSHQNLGAYVGPRKIGSNYSSLKMLTILIYWVHDSPLKSCDSAVLRHSGMKDSLLRLWTWSQPLGRPQSQGVWDCVFGGRGGGEGIAIRNTLSSLWPRALSLSLNLQESLSLQRLTSKSSGNSAFKKLPCKFSQYKFPSKEEECGKAGLPCGMG